MDYGGLTYRHMRTAATKATNLFGQMLAQADSSGKAAWTEHIVWMEAANFILVGSDTTAVALTYLT